MNCGGFIDGFQSKSKEIENRYTCFVLALKDIDTPIPAKILSGVTVAYALSPVDLIPDFIPVLGYLDDLILLPLLVTLTLKLISDDVLERNRKQAEDIWKDGIPIK